MSDFEDAASQLATGAEATGSAEISNAKSRTSDMETPHEMR